MTQIPEDIECQIARRAINILEEYGWNQGEFISMNGTRCIVGAIDKAALLVGILYDNPLYAYKTKVVTQLSMSVGMSIIEWNDAPGRTKEQVIKELAKVCDAGI